ncbi:ribonuclease Z [Brevibacillus dissolubilis]|uniref:ribonuclease Z n=1 Tax=Brevibacillus dissolubilis TaxID=1844116 RepID=UPI00111754C2|nr:ribonuclease Z [Brevibacillus dissolubilis]
MLITFLGTGSGAPSSKRNVSAIGLTFIQKGKWWLFDCGEGTQHQIIRSSLNLNSLEKIFITHLHGDHLYGLMGLLGSRSLRGSEHTGPLTLYGPPGLEKYVKAIMEISPVHLQYELTIKTVEPGIIYEDDDLIVETAPVSHRIPAYSYSVTEKPRPGVFRVDLAKSEGVPAGPLYARLKRGEIVELPDGRIVHGTDFVGPPQPGLKFAYSGDTVPVPEFVALAQDADVIIHEATYVHEHVELAERAGHSTAWQAANVAKEANAKALFLTHFSPRYENMDDRITMDDLLAEAQSVFPETHLAHDFLQYEIKRTRDTE